MAARRAEAVPSIKVDPPFWKVVHPWFVSLTVTARRVDPRRRASPAGFRFAQSMSLRSIATPCRLLKLFHSYHRKPSARSPSIAYSKCTTRLRCGNAERREAWRMSGDISSTSPSPRSQVADTRGSGGIRHAIRFQTETRDLRPGKDGTVYMITTAGQAHWICGIKGGNSRLVWPGLSL